MDCDSPPLEARARSRVRVAGSATVSSVLYTASRSARSASSDPASARPTVPETRSQFRAWRALI